MYTRFEFGGTGIFHSLDVIEDMIKTRADEEDLEWAQREFDEYLTVPNLPIGYRTESYFTEKGLAEFKEPLDIIINMYYQAEDIGFGELTVVESDLNGREVIYQDEHQIIVAVS